MDNKLRYGAPGIAALLEIGLLLTAGQATAAEYWLCAKAGTVTMPGGQSVPIWGYVQDSAGFAGNCAATAALPGPALVVPPGDTTLTIHLRNDLTLEPTSIVIPGQSGATMVPVKFADGQGRQRVRSFTHEAAAGGGTADYVWNNVRPGTYLYHSGTHPQVQVQMGLYGALTGNFAAAPNQAYDGVPYDAEATLLFSEIDPAQHAAIANGTYGNAATPTACQDTSGAPLPMTSTLCYKPKFFLVNGKPFQAGDAPLASLSQGQSTLLRLINAGYRAYVPLLQGMHMKMVAEDGNRYQYREDGVAYPRDQYQYSTWLAALKTTDVIITPAATGSYAFYDRRLNTVNAGAQDGGIFGKLSVAAALAADVAITTTDGLASVNAGDPIQYTIVASNAGPGAAPIVTVSDVMPANLTGVTWTCTATVGSSCPASGSGSINAPVSLAATGSATFVVNATVSPSASGTLANTASVTVTSVDPNAANNSATDSTTVASAASANLGITKTDGVATAIPGAPLTYTIVVSNAGPNTATGATVTDTMPAALTGVSWSCTASAGSTCGSPSGTGSISTTVNLASGGSATFAVNGTVASGASGTLVNTATVTAPVGVTDPNAANNSATDTDTIQVGPTVVAYFSTTGNTAVPGVAGTNDDADIYAYRSDGSYARTFDASTTGVPGDANVDAFIYKGPNDIYLSFNNNGGVNLTGLNGVQDEDIVRWNGTAWSLYFDGSDVGLGNGGNNEDVRAFSLLPDGSLVISTVGSASVGGGISGVQQDLLRCAPGTFGVATTCGPWSVYFDGSDVAMTQGGEAITYTKVLDNGTIQLRTSGSFSVSGLSGNATNVFSCNSPTTGASSACASFSNVLTLPALGTGSMDAIYLP